MDLQLRWLLQLQIFFLADHVRGNSMHFHTLHHADLCLQRVLGKRGIASDVSLGFWRDTFLFPDVFAINLLGLPCLACEQVNVDN